MKIAVVGKMRSGKNTVADLLTEEYGFQQLAFADGITEIIKKYFPEAFTEGKPRGHYQHIGQGMRELNPNVWINHVNRRVTNILCDGYMCGVEPNVIVTDCRQKNEEMYLRRNGFKIIKVEADDQLRLQRIASAGEYVTPEQFNHDTERQVELIEADYLIDNNGTYEELKQEVFNAYNFFRAEREMGHESK